MTFLLRATVPQLDCGPPFALFFLRLGAFLDSPALFERSRLRCLGQLGHRLRRLWWRLWWQLLRDRREGGHPDVHRHWLQLDERLVQVVLDDFYRWGNVERVSE